MNESTWDTLLEGLNEMNSFYPEALVVIGGVAVYFLTQKNQQAVPEISHDVDLALSMEAYSELREIYDTTKNKRLGKSQFVRKDLEYDVYVANQNSLVIPYESLVAHSVEAQGVRVANPAHLLVLKLAAARDRQNSSKGDKDVRDIIRIMGFLSGDEVALALPFMTVDDVDFLDNIAKNRLKSFSEVAGQDMVKTRSSRHTFQQTMDTIRHATVSAAHGHQRPRIP